MLVLRLAGNINEQGSSFGTGRLYHLTTKDDQRLSQERLFGVFSRPNLAKDYHKSLTWGKE